MHWMVDACKGEGKGLCKIFQNIMCIPQFGAFQTELFKKFTVNTLQIDTKYQICQHKPGLKCGTEFSIPGVHRFRGRWFLCE